MNLFAALLGGALLAVFTAIQTWINSGRFNRIESEITTLRTDLSREIASLRSDLLHVALDRRRDD